MAWLGGHMTGRNERGWQVVADLGCLAAGCAAIFLVIVRFDLVGRLSGHNPDGTGVQQPLLLVTLVALALVLFGYRRWRELDASQAVAGWVHRDALTGLPDRVVFQERLQAALEAGRTGYVAVLVLDVDRVRLVNASYGNRGGDEVLASLAERLHAVLGPEDLLVRLAGDQFAVLCTNIYDARHAEQVAERVRQGLVRPFGLGAEQIWLSVSVGMAVDDGSGDSATVLLRDAELALERAQAKGTGRHVLVDRSARAASASHHELVQRLRAALRLGQFRLRYQPLVSTADG